MNEYGGIFTIFALKRVKVCVCGRGDGGEGVWLLASSILIIFVLGTSNKGQGGLVTSFPSLISCILEISSYIQKWFREKIHFVAVAGKNHYFKDGLPFEAV